MIDNDKYIFIVCIILVNLWKVANINGAKIIRKSKYTARWQSYDFRAPDTLNVVTRVKFLIILNYYQQFAKLLYKFYCLKWPFCGLNDIQNSIFIKYSVNLFHRKYRIGMPSCVCATHTSYGSEIDNITLIRGRHIYSSRAIIK